MQSVVYLIIVALVLSALSALIPKAGRGRRGVAGGTGGRSPAVAERAPAYAPADSFLTPAERSFFGVLLKACGPDAHVSCKVRLADVLKPLGTASQWQTGFNMIQSKHIDFVICKASTMDVHCCVELNDSSHEREDRRDRDEFLCRALAGAGVPLVAFKARRGYSVQEVNETLLQAINGAPRSKVRAV